MGFPHQGMPWQVTDRSGRQGVPVDLRHSRRHLRCGPLIHHSGSLRLTLGGKEKQ